MDPVPWLYQHDCWKAHACSFHGHERCACSASWCKQSCFNIRSILSRGAFVLARSFSMRRCVPWDSVQHYLRSTEDISTFRMCFFPALAKRLHVPISSICQRHDQQVLVPIWRQTMAAIDHTDRNRSCRSGAVSFFLSGSRHGDVVRR